MAAGKTILAKDTTVSSWLQVWMNWHRLTEYWLRFRSQALIQRMGYLLDLLQLPAAAQVRDLLLAGIGKSTPYVGRPRKWGTGGTYDSTWHIVDNVPRQEPLAEIGV